MKTKRYKKRPSSLHVQGAVQVHQRSQQGVHGDGDDQTSVHPPLSVKKVQFGGDLEVQEMCFYIPAEHQASPPTPLDTSPVFIQRPSMHVSTLSVQWLYDDGGPVAGEEGTAEDLNRVNPTTTAVLYQRIHSWTMTNRRNEVWIQSLEAGVPRCCRRRRARGRG